MAIRPQESDAPRARGPREDQRWDSSIDLRASRNRWRKPKSKRMRRRNPPLRRRPGRAVGPFQTWPETHRPVAEHRHPRPVQTGRAAGRRRFRPRLVCTADSHGHGHRTRQFDLRAGAERLPRSRGQHGRRAPNYPGQVAGIIGTTGTTDRVCRIRSDRHHGRGGQRFGQDDVDRQAGAHVPRPGQTGGSGRGRYVPGGGGRAVDDLGRTRRGRTGQGRIGRRSGQRRASRGRPSPGERGRGMHRGHGGTAANAG